MLLAIPPAMDATTRAIYNYDVPNAVRVIVTKDVPLKTGRDLNGKTVAVPALSELFAIACAAAAYANAHQAEMVQLIVKYSKMDESKVAALPQPGSGTLSNRKPAMMQPLIDAAAKYKVIPRGFSAAELIDPTASA